MVKSVSISKITKWFTIHSGEHIGHVLATSVSSALILFLTILSDKPTGKDRLERLGALPV